MKRCLLCAALAAMLTGCGNYADFRLPPPPGRPSSSIPAVRWEVLPSPVLARGPAGDWDSVDALNPSVVRYRGLYHNLYSGFDGRAWRTGLATSQDGISWVKHGPMISTSASWEGDYMAANGAVLVVAGEFLYWYQAGSPPRIGLARSRDGRGWSKQAGPVLATGPRGSWDERGVADPWVSRIGGLFYMYYLGQDRARRQRLGLARSPDGVRWEKLRSNPVLELGPMGSFDEAGLGEPAVWTSHGRHWMLYTGRDRGENRRVLLAGSRDGVHWERVPEAPRLAGNQAWNSKVVCDPSVEVDGDTVRVWFGGGDQARPDERLNGQIGLALLRMSPAEAAR